MKNLKIYLTGMPGSGKTTLGKSISKKLGIQFIDLDEVIEEKAGMTINEIFSKYGELYFRKLESDCLRETTKKIDQFIMATGGGAPCFLDNQAFINKNGQSIYLKVSANELFKRLSQKTSHRPLLKDKSRDELLSELQEKIKTREPFYLSSDVVISSDNISLENLIERLEEKSKAKGNA